ncbi:hypothetical protein AMAG_01504 [Allomyces macrogynus ATCC 38327]|uniref:MoxR domain-containing protein n=1 Tax=Allomyces macrogynus (strain ATCC 38327) TaxID=578462 RepID=A0A0L0RZN5_ALLM3|nr:hypothetical protein AMAG_01504 [Allomyces macrogynus ATCC 38327]|eukprot:KNE55615.1 hypothetical protein AMAG_01504 [Allomyces macrogynus ATCC 38327]
MIGARLHHPIAAAVHAKAKKILKEISQDLVDRDECLRVLMLGLLTGQNVLILGPPGTAKTKAVHDLFACVNATSYKSLLHASMSTETLVGPVDLSVLKKESQIMVNTKGMLPTAELVFLDEIFKANRNVLSILLGLLNERVFANGPNNEPVPLHFTAAASNETFLDPGQSPLLDRFPLRVFVGGLPRGTLRDQLTEQERKSRPHRRYHAAVAEAKADAAAAGEVTPECASAKDGAMRLDLDADIYALLDALDEMRITKFPIDVHTMLMTLVDYANSLNAAGEEKPQPESIQTRSQEVYCGDVVTNRGIVMFSDMLRISAFLHGRGTKPCVLDLWPLSYMSWRTKKQRDAVTKRMLAEICRALPPLIRNHEEARWMVGAIRDHLFLPNAVKGALYSEILADLVRAGAEDEVFNLLQDPNVDPSRNDGKVLQAAKDGKHQLILTMLRQDDRIDTSALDREEEEERQRAAAENSKTRALSQSSSSSSSWGSGSASDRVKLSAAQAFRGKNVGEPNWIRAMKDDKSSEGQVLRIREYRLDIFTTNIQLSNGMWDFLLRFKLDDSALPKINIEVNVQTAAIGADNQVVWTSNTLARAKDVQLVPTKGFYIQWRFPEGPVNVQSSKGMSKVSLRMFTTSSEKRIDNLYLDTVEARAA